LLCAGLIGWRSLGIAGEGKALGLYGFGAAAHIIAQAARWQGRLVYAFTRPGDVATQAFARSLGAAWILFMHYIDMYWLIMPNVDHHFEFTPLADLGCWFFVIGVVMATMLNYARQSPGHWMLVQVCGTRRILLRRLLIQYQPKGKWTRSGKRSLLHGVILNFKQLLILKISVPRQREHS